MIGWFAGVALLGILDLGMLVVKWLAVAGGAAIGALMFGVVGQFWSKRMMRRPASKPMMLVLRLLGALLMGSLVWAFVFGSGGGGGLGGSGSGFWPFGAKGSQGSASEDAATSKQPPQDTARGPRVESLKIRILGGKRVENQRFYVIDAEKPRDWDELKETVLERRQHNPALQEIEILLYKDSVDRQNPAVTKLDKWARENGFKPSYPPTDKS